MNQFTIERSFRAKVEALFGAFRQPEILAQWIAPSDDITISIIDFNFHVEGSYRYQFTLPNGEARFVYGNFTQIDEPTSIGFTWFWEKPDPHAGIESHVHVSIAPAKAGSILKLTHQKLDATGMSKRHASGWEGAFNRLTDFFNQIKDK